MPKAQLAPIRISPADGELSKLQKSFNKQIEQLEKIRAELEAWEAAGVAYQAKFAGELAPLLTTEKLLQRQLALALDRCSCQKGLSRAEQSMLAEMVVDLCEHLLEFEDDAELKALYHTHSGIDYDVEEAAELQRMKDLFEDMTGVDLGGAGDIDSPEALLRHAEEQMRQQAAEAEAAQQAREQGRRQRKKSTKQSAREEQARLDAEQITQSLREIYRKLMSALHPDREPDADERERKTALVQRANQAYEQRNLLQLLELQLEVEHIDQNTVSRLDDARLGHYNAILKEQLAELRLERMRVEMDFRARFGIDIATRLRPETALRHLAKDIVLAQQNQRYIKQMLTLLTDVKAVKYWLKGLRQQQREMGDFSF